MAARQGCVGERGRAMAKRKYTFFRFREYETQAFAEYLEMMAAKGWYLENIINRMCQCFIKGEPRKLKFSVVVLPPGADTDSPFREEAAELRDLCEGAGWQLQYGGALWQVFYSEEEDLIPIETDPKLQLKIQKSISLSFLDIFGGLFPVVIVFQQVYLLLKNPGQGLADLRRLTACAVICFLWSLLVLRLLSIACWYRRAEKRVAVSGCIPDVSFRSVKRRNCGFFVTLVVAVLIMVFSFTESLTVRMIWLTALAAFAGVYLTVHLAVERSGEGTGWDRSVAAAVAGVLLGLTVVMMVVAGLNRVFPSYFTDDGGEYTRLTAFPVEFEALGYEPDPEYYWYSGRTPLAAYQSEDGRRTGEQGEKRELRMEYYESPVPAVISKTKSLYPMIRGTRWELAAVERFEEGGVFVERYHYKPGVGAEFSDVGKDIYVISDRNRLLVLDFSGNAGPDEIGPAVDGFGGGR